MNTTILMIKTELAKKKKNFAELKIKTVRLFNELLNVANPYFGDNIELIKAEEIDQIARELLRTKTDLTNIKRAIVQLESDLGENNG